jgi:hypothetical protein
MNSSNMRSSESASANLVELVFQGGHHAEIAAATAEAPEEILVRMRAGSDELPIGGDHIGGDEVVDREPASPCQVADATAQREARDACGRDDAAGRCQAESVGGVVEVAPCGTGISAGRLGLRIHTYGAHRRHIDDQAAIGGAESGGAVGTVAD